MANNIIKWTWRKRIQVAFLALLVQYQAAREMLRPALADPEYVPAALRIPGESAILAAQPAVAADPSFLG